jgi:membrane protease YdiL (CAAX protease family)
VLATSAVAWLHSDELPAAARLWTVTLLIPLPYLMVLQARQLRDLTELPRRAAYVSSIVSVWVLALISILITRVSEFGAREIGFFAAPLTSIAVWTLALTAAGIAMLFLFRAAGFHEARVLRELLPQTGSDRALFAALSLSAGICEEIAFRGFLLHALGAATGSTALALFLSSGSFGVVHAYQLPIGALRAGLLGALLAVPLLVGQPIYAPIIAHVCIDLLSGLWLARYLLR